MRYGSVCSGVEAASVAWEPLGWEPVFFSEIEPFPSAVLAHHWPDVPNYGDMTRFEEWGDQDIDILVGGTPCQSFSVAGLRKGLTDDRGNLSLTYMRMVDRYRPRWTIWENVPGVLSSNGGRDFGAIVGALAELRYSCAWRVLDAQNFGVPQRRRRVFLVGCSTGDWRDPASVLFESGCGGRDFEASREAREGNTGGAAKCLTAYGTRLDLESETFVTHASDIAPSITSSGPPYSRTGNQRVECDALVAVHQNASGDIRSSNVAYTLNTNSNASGRNSPLVMQSANANKFDAIAIAENTIGRQPMNGGNGNGFTVGGPMYTLNATGVHAVTQSMAVRRLTPVEAERLQGFPDGHTDIGWKGKATPDSHRYKAMGNSMAVPVMRWIGQRIKEHDA